MMNLFSFKTKYHNYEILIMRILFGCLVFKSFIHTPVFATQNYPVGIAQYFDLTFLSDPQLFPWLQRLFFISVIMYVFGICLIAALGYMFFYVVSIMTLQYSQGGVGHGFHIIGLAIMGQLVGHVWGFIKYRKIIKTPNALNRNDLVVYCTQQFIAAAYVVAGIAKLLESGFIYGVIPAWLIRVKFIPANIIKCHDQLYYGTLQEGLLERGLLIGNFLAQHPTFTQLAFSFGLFIELAAFLLLINRFWSVLIGASLILLHIGIMILMKLHFWSNISVLFIFTLHAPWLMMMLITKLHLALKSKEKHDASSQTVRIVFYDGVCSLCDGFIQSLLTKDINQIFKVAPLQGKTAEKTIGAQTGNPKEWSIIFYEDGQIYKKSDAVLRIYKNLGGIYRVLSCLTFVPKGLRDFVYDLIAQSRYRIFGKYDVCRIPTKSERLRILD